MIDIYVMIWHLKSLNLKTILRPSIVGGMPLKRIHVVPSLNFKCTPQDCIRLGVLFVFLGGIKH
jgi:hypothetical protein